MDFHHAVAIWDAIIIKVLFFKPTHGFEHQGIHFFEKLKVSTPEIGVPAGRYKLWGFVEVPGVKYRAIGRHFMDDLTSAVGALRGLSK